MQIAFVVLIGVVMYGDMPRRIEGLRKYMERRVKVSKGDGK